MSKSQATPRRAYGTGELYTRTDSRGRQTWYGKWYAAGTRVKRRIGEKRGAGWPDGVGLTQTQAEAALRGLTAGTEPASAPARDRVTLADADERYRRHLQVKRRKRTTIMAVESCMRVWWNELYGDRTLDTITPEEVEDGIAMMEAGNRPGSDDGRPLAAKSIVNYVGILGAVYHHAMHPRRRWATVDPTDAVDLPDLEDDDDIRFLDLAECEALQAAAVASPYTNIDRAFYVVAPQTGLRHGELRGLRWKDVDWLAEKIRVRQNYVRGHFGTPKTRRSTRAVPMSLDVGIALERLFKSSAYQADDHLVFADPVNAGRPLSERANLRRFRRALKAARLDETHVIHDLRHTYGTTMAAAGTPMRKLQEWMGHRSISTTERYADYSPGENDAELVRRAFCRGPIQGPNLSEPQRT